VARRDVSTNAVHYYFSDHLGTHAVVENAAGTACEQDIDYYPYGGEQNDYCATPVAQNYKFNGKERDTESGLDMFGARYYGSSLGRFMTPDWAAKPVNVPYAHFGNPQSLNLYSYVQNNPTTVGDPDGHCCWDEIVNWFSSSHSASGSAGVDAGHSVDKAGPVTINSKALYADASGSASYGSGGVKASAQAGVGVVSEKATEGSIGTTSIKATSGDAEAHAGVSLTGVNAGAGANADVLSATQTVKLGPVTLSATGNVGIGAEASASVSTTGVSASAGITPGFGGAVSVSINFGQGSVSGGASAQSTNTGTGIKTTVDTPKIKPQSE
jgi:RHS repeat-associated protein